MTVPADTVTRLTHTGAGTTGPFTTPYFLANADIRAVKTLIADGTETVLVITTDYTLTGAGDEDGGALTLVSSLSSSYRLTIINDPVDSQETDYPRTDPFPAASHEAALDRRTMVSLRQRDLIDRSLKFSDGVNVSGVDTELPAAEAGAYLRVNTGGTGFEFVSEVDPADSSASFLQSGTGSVARTWTAKVGEMVSVLDFIPTALHAGIRDSTGTTDLTTYVQAAIDAIYTLYEGGRVWFPGGGYRISQIKLKSRVVLVGESWKASLASIDSNSQSSMITTFDTSVVYAGIENFFINGNKANQSTNVDIIDLNNSGVSGSHRNFVRNCFIYEAKRHGILCRSQHADIQNCHIYGADGNGLYGDNVHDCNVFQTRVFTTGDACVKLAGCANWDFNNVRVWDAGQVTAANGYGFWLESGTIACTGDRFTACDSQDNLASGWYLDSATLCQISGIHGNNTDSAFKFKSGSGHRISGTVEGSRIAPVNLLEIDTTSPRFCEIDISYGSSAFSGSMLNGTFAEDNLIRVRNNTANDGTKISHGYMDFAGTAVSQPAIKFSGTYPAHCLDFNSVTAAGGAIRFKGGGAIAIVGRNNAGSGNLTIARVNSSDEWQFDTAVRMVAQLRFNAGADMVLGTATGTKIGTATSQLLSFWNATPVAQPSSTGEASGYTGGGGTALTHTDTFTGNSGTKAYTINDIVKHLKAAGLVAAS